MSEGEIMSILTIILSFLVVSNFSWILSKYIKVSFTIILVFIGLIISILDNFSSVFSGFFFGPELIFYFLLPILLFESAYHINFRKLTKDFWFVTILATLGVGASSLVIGLVLTYALNLPWLVSFLFAIFISSTDPVAVVSIFKNLGVPRRLVRIIDTESMINDATSVVLAKLILSIAAFGFSPLNILKSSGDFIYIVLISILVGIGLSYLVAFIINKLNNEMTVEVTLVLVLALSTFMVSEKILEGSGIIATVAAGLYLGNFGKLAISSKVKPVLNSLMEYMTFLANSLVFLFIGLNLNLFYLFDNIALIFGIYLLVTVSRGMVVYGFGYLANKVKGKNYLPNNFLHVLQWGGLRGALPIALSLSVLQFAPASVGNILSETDLYTLFHFTTGVVFFGIIINGTTIGLLVNKQIDSKY